VDESMTDRTTDDQMTDDEGFLQVAIEEARRGRAEGGIPIGAALVVDGRVLGAGRNRRVQQGSAIRHGETDALEIAGRQPASVYARATMYTTLSPCDMCTGAVLLYKIPRVVIGENRTFMGAEDLLRSRGVEVVNLDSPECVRMMQEFIAAHPELWWEDIGEQGS
jgi:creatinine deaminase